MSKVLGQQVATVIETLYCTIGHADIIAMEFTGSSVQERGRPPLFVHKCPECGYAESIVGHTYPRTVEVPVGEPHHVP